MEIEWIRKKVASGEYLWTLHADEERRNDGLKIADVEKILIEGRILEPYPSDPRGASCLIGGEVGNTAVHVVCGSNKQEQLVIITVYRPEPPKWKTPWERSSK